jgi:hypothetical protein
MKSQSVFALLLCGLFIFKSHSAIRFSEDGYHVFPGDEIQDALQLASSNKTNKTVWVHEGDYFPSSKRQALIWLNKRHDGIHLQAQGKVTLSAANPQLATPSEAGYPAVVNHVVYFGDGISSNTVLSGFRITGANGFMTKKLTRQIEPNTTVPKNLFFLTDGGAIKVFGRSYPVIKNIQVVNNYTTPCGAGISVQHQGFNDKMVLIQNCIFQGNRTQVTGAALDLLEGSAAHIVNCLFVENVSNTGEDIIAKRAGEPLFTNNGVLTVFQNSWAIVEQSTFTGNRNGVDDLGGKSSYQNCIFSDNVLDAGLKGQSRYELNINEGAKVTGCFIRGSVLGSSHSLSKEQNSLNPPPPEFDKNFVPQSAVYKGAGYRPELN